ncbi:heterokaryon incompatibility protein-domain-containing protein [Xylariales sp. AK1849]|nr:heterokaryon incompatibility protein-domain-containing protein [Xylariales sp. AK1849]
MALDTSALAFLIIRLVRILRALLHFTILAFLDRFLPTWLAISLIILDLLLRFSKVENVISQAVDSPPMGRLGCCAIVTGSAVAWALCTATRFRLVLYNGLLDHFLGVVIATLLDLFNDEPPTRTSQDWLVQRDSAVLYGIATYVLTHREVALHIISWSASYVFISVICYITPLLLLRGYMGHTDLLYRIISWPLSAFGTLMTSSLDIYSLGVAILVYFIPNHVDRILSRRNQERRRHRGAPAYIYDPLGAQEIRLLQLQRRFWIFEDNIKTTIIHCRLDSAPNYEAISYHWGSNERTDEILIYDRGVPMRFPVTKSAFDLLLARRSIWRKRTIWIDAICINQNNDLEKATQVQCMREIYQRASRVIIFPSSDWFARAAAPLLQELHMGAQISDDSVRSLRKMAIGQRDSRKWRTILGLFTNDYFSRIWVAQEIAVGRDVQLYYGGHYIPWFLYHKVVSQMADQPSRDLIATGVEGNLQTWHNSSTYENITAFSVLRKDSPYDVRHDGQLRLELVILSTSKFEATNPRDQIFAILGISDYADSDLLKVDYEKSTEKVLEDATRYLLLEQAQPAIDVLCLAGIGFSANRLAVPSWVVERSEDRYCIQYTDPRQNEDCFRASGTRVASITAGETSGTIYVRGVLLKDKIRYLSSAGVFNFGNIRPELMAQSQDGVSFETTDEVLEALWNKLEPKDLGNYLPLRYLASFMEACFGRCFVMTETGRLCLGPPLTQVGDAIFIPFGAQTAYIVRWGRSQKFVDSYELIGEAYAQGAMMGEAMGHGGDELVIMLV